MVCEAEVRARSKQLTKMGTLYVLNEYHKRRAVVYDAHDLPNPLSSFSADVHSAYFLVYIKELQS